MNRFCLFLFLGVFVAHPVAAADFESHPEFQSLDENESSLIEGPARLSNVYSADLLTYSTSDESKYEELARARVLGIDIGSVSASHFMVDSGLKIHAPLAEGLEFRFTYFDDRDLENESQHHIIELVAKPTPWLGLSLYGEPDLYKRRDDTGIALLFWPGEHHEVRLFNTFVDVTRLKRNDLNDRFIEPDLPNARGLVGRVWSDPETKSKEFLEYALRYETKTRWLFPDQKYEFFYWKAMGSVYLRKRMSDHWFMGLRSQVDSKFEERTPTDATSTVAASNWRRDRFLLAVHALFTDLGPGSRWSIDVGTKNSFRVWQSDVGEARYMDYLNHVELQMPGFAGGRGTDSWSLGYVLGLHRSFGPSSFFNSDEEDGLVSHRLNLSYTFLFSDRARIKLQISGDLNRYGTPKSWEGGNGQLTLAF